MGPTTYSQAFLAARQWQERISHQREYSVIRDGNVFSAGLGAFNVPRSEYAQAHLLKHRLIDAYEGCSVEEVFHGEEMSTDTGGCFCIQDEIEVPPVGEKRGDVGERLKGELTLLHGIGRYTESHLKKRGYTSISKLLRHPRFGREAEKVLAVLERGNTEEIMKLIIRWYSPSHPSVLRTSFLHEPEDMIFFDIETLGLCSRPIILFGIGTLRSNTLHVRQYLLRDIDEEEASITAVLTDMAVGNPVIISFNGKSFDVPYLSDRCAYYRIPGLPQCPHYDMLHFSRREWKSVLPDCRLQTIEREIFGLRRTNDVPSAMVPEFYAAYLESGNPGPLVPIVQHNREDLITLVKIFSTLRMRGG